jgi:aminopeptidase N
VGDTLLRAETIGALGRFGDSGVIAEARRRFAAFPADPNALPPAIAEAALNVVGAHADAATYARLRALGQAADGTEAKLRYYYALAMAEDPALIDETVGIALTDEISNGRVNRFLARAAADGDDPDRVWRDVLPVADTIAKKMVHPEDLLPPIASQSSDPATAEQLLGLPVSHGSSGAGIAAAAAAEEIGARGELKQRLMPALGDWLRSH